MYFRFLVICCLFCFALSASAQQLLTVDGVIFKKNTPDIISRVSVTNLNRKITVTSDDLGSFHIRAALDDTLLFRKDDYTAQTYLVKNFNPSIYLQPVIHLNEVAIKDQSRKQELNDVLDDYKKKGQYYTLNPSAMAVINSPLTGLYELFGKDPAAAKKFRQYSIEEQQRAQVAKRYNKKVVQDVTRMPDSEVQDFMLAFTPSYEDIQVMSDYDIVTYIKKNYEYYINNKNALKIQKLY